MHGASDSIVPQSGQILYFGAPVKLESSKVLTGCNVYHTSTVIRQRVIFGSLAKATSESAGPGFAAAFLERFQGLQSFVPGNGLSDGFVARLTSPQGADFSEVLLEAILAVENSLAFAMHDLDTIGYAAVETHANHCDLIWGCSIPRLSRGAAEVGLAGILDLLPRTVFARPPNGGPGFSTAYRELRDLAVRRRLSPTTAVLKQAAKQRGLPCEVPGWQHLRLGQGSAQQQIYSSLTGTTSITAQKICADKRLTNRRLAELRLPVPRQVKVDSVHAARAAAATLGFPIVVKPVRGRKGGGVSAGLTSPDEIDAAFRSAHEQGSDVLIERFIPGNDYRLLVIGGTCVAALTRQPPRIVGNGKATVDQLIDELNTHPWRDGFRLFPVARDAELGRLLTRSGLRPGDVLETGRSVPLRSAANVSTGGVPIDVSDEVHPDNRVMAERAASGIGLDVAGIDFITTDIARSFREVGGGVIEMNARPGLCMHTWPLEGKPRNVAGEVLKLCVPPGTDGRIPIVAVAGDKGTGAIARALDMILRGTGSTVALALRTRAFVNGISAELTQAQQSRTLQILLRDPQVDTLVSTVSPRKAARRGLLLDRCTVTVIRDKVKVENTELFHRGIEILARATTDCFVLGAANTVARERLQDLGARRLILVSERYNDPRLRAHLDAGHTAVTTLWQEDEVRIVLMSGSELVASFAANAGTSRDGRSRKKRLKEGIMFAIAAAHALGLSGAAIAAALEHAPPIVPDTN